MGIKWRNWSSKYKQKLLTSGFLMLLSSIAFLYIDLTKPAITSKNDLTFITAPFIEYNWVQYTKGSSLTFSLEGYSNEFKIKADFFGILKKTEFKNISRGELITIGIPKDKHWNNPCFVYSITSDKELFLDNNQTIRKHNSFFVKAAAGIMILISFFSIYAGYCGYKRRW